MKHEASRVMSGFVFQDKTFLTSGQVTGSDAKNLILISFFSFPKSFVLLTGALGRKNGFISAF